MPAREAPCDLGQEIKDKKRTHDIKNAPLQNRIENGLKVRKNFSRKMWQMLRPSVNAPLEAAEMLQQDRGYRCFFVYLYFSFKVQLPGKKFV